MQLRQTPVTGRSAVGDSRGQHSLTTLICETGVTLTPSAGAESMATPAVILEAQADPGR